MKPKPPLRIEASVITKQGATAVYYFTIFVDADGNRFFAQDAKFCYDLKPITEFWVGTNSNDRDDPGIIAGPFDIPPVLEPSTYLYVKVDALFKRA